jgi:hypothetical protein
MAYNFIMYVNNIKIKNYKNVTLFYMENQKSIKNIRLILL